MKRILVAALMSVSLTACGSGESASELVTQGCESWIIENKPDDFSRSISLFRQASNLDKQYRELTQSAIAWREYLAVLEKENVDERYRTQIGMKLRESWIVFTSYCEGFDPAG